MASGSFDATNLLWSDTFGLEPQSPESPNSQKIRSMSEGFLTAPFIPVGGNVRTLNFQHYQKNIYMDTGQIGAIFTGAEARANGEENSPHDDTHAKFNWGIYITLLMSTVGGGNALHPVRL